MKDLKDMTAAELVAELEDATSMCMNECNDCGHQHRKIKGEGFCNGCGIQFVIFHNRKLRTRCTSAPDRLKAGSVADITAELDARCEDQKFQEIWRIISFPPELHALLGYLLSKEVNNG